MEPDFDTHTKKIVYSFFLVALYLTLYILSNNPIISFIITINVLYFSREILYSLLFESNKTAEVFQEEVEQLAILEEELEILPDNIKQKLQMPTKKTQVAILNTNIIETSPQEELFITAIQKAELLINKRITELESRRKTPFVKKKQITLESSNNPSQYNSKKEEKIDQWDTWVPLSLNDKFTNLSIYCDKCDTLLQLQDLSYEVTKEPNYFQLFTKHQKENEIHTNNVKVTLDSFEILSKPTLTVSPIQEVEV